MDKKEKEELQDYIEQLNSRVFEEFAERRFFEPVVAMVVKTPQGEYDIRFMGIPSIYMLEGRKGEKGWHSLQRRMLKMVVHARMDGMKVLLLYHAAVPEDYSDERIVIITKTGVELEHVQERHYLPEDGPMTVDEVGKLKLGIPSFREL